jgi:hypothetical protein
MLTFYPKDLPIWGDRFCFTNDITLVTKEKYDHTSFDTYRAFLTFLEECGVTFTDPNNKVELRSTPYPYERWGVDPHTVVQGDVIYGTITTRS